MIFKRRIPKVAVAAFTMGGTAAATGCGDSDPVEKACKTFVRCAEINYGYTYYDVDECIADYDSYLSYIDDADCEHAARRLLGCLGGLSCSQLYNDAEDVLCASEYDQFYDDCYFLYYYY